MKHSLERRQVVACYALLAFGVASFGSGALFGGGRTGGILPGRSYSSTIPFFEGREHLVTTQKKQDNKKELARAYADRLVLSGIARVQSTLRLAELATEVGKHGISLAQLRQLLGTNPDRFAYHDRRWLPTPRVSAGQGPLAEQIRRTLEAYSAPMKLEELASELSASRGNSKEYYLQHLPSMLNRDYYMFATESGLAGLRTWVYAALTESDERALWVNGLTKEDVDSIKTICDKVNFLDPQAAAKTLVKHLPLNVRAVGYWAWKKLNPDDPYAARDYDPVALFDALVTQPGTVFGADGLLHDASEAPGWLKAAIKEAEKSTPVVEVEESAPLEFKGDDLKDMVTKILRMNESFSVSKMLEEKYELTPADRTYPEDLANAVNALKANEEIWWVGGDRFRKPGSAPEFIMAIPEFFQFQATEFLDEDGELIDVELSDDGFSSALRKELSVPAAMDVLDEEILPKSKKQPDSVTCSLKSLHREIGTFPLCQIPTGWLGETPNIQELVFVDPQGRELGVWLNNEARLLFNLIDWWFEQPVESGAMFSLTKTARPNVYEFKWLEETDPLLFISSDRMEQLRDLAARATELSTYEILMEVVGHYNKGADFVTILAETNVVRRVSRRTVASILTGYHCFYQRSGSPVWHYDAKKVDQGFDKAKRKFARK